LLRQGSGGEQQPVPVLNNAQGLRLVVDGGELRVDSALVVENAVVGPNQRLRVGPNQRLRIELFADAQATGEAIFVHKLDAATQWTPKLEDLTALPATVFARAVIVSLDQTDGVELESPLLRLSVSR
jgi:hypothetical protein